MNFFPAMMPFDIGGSGKSKTRPQNFAAKKKKKRQMAKESRRRNRTNGKRLIRK